MPGKMPQILKSRNLMRLFEGFMRPMSRIKSDCLNPPQESLPLLQELG